MSLTTSQRRTPCRECPFSRAISPGALGGSSPLVYIGQTEAGFWMPCHCAKNYAAKESVPGEVEECAGAAIFRANCNRQAKAPLLDLPKDEERIFADYAEFLAHHLGVSTDAAECFLVDYPPDVLQAMELLKAKLYAVPRTEGQIISTPEPTEFTFSHD